MYLIVPIKAKTIPRKYASNKYTIKSTTPITTFLENKTPNAVIPNRLFTMGHPHINNIIIATPFSATLVMVAAPPLIPTDFNIIATRNIVRITIVIDALDCKK